VRGEFFHDPAPTDVITFPYGEILIGAGVVSENAGLLPLAGWNGQTVRDAKDMAQKQEQIFKIARRMVCSGNS
jgi:ssRNA-specific RNase YbeY (16S rRNA maturation enzyme)